MDYIHKNEIYNIVTKFSPPLFKKLSNSKQAILISYGKNPNNYLVEDFMLPFDSNAKDLVYIKNIYMFLDKLESKMTKQDHFELQQKFDSICLI